MLCEKCKEREAKVHVTRISAGKQTSVHLCQSCAQDSGVGASQSSVSLPQLLNKLVGGSENESAEFVEKKKQKTCTVCGMSYYDFKQTGRFGCANCYMVFRPNLTPILQKVQQGESHQGKVPKRSGVRIADQIEELRNRLKRAVQDEEFETAARLRDEIRSLEEQASQPSQSSSREDASE